MTIELLLFSLLLLITKWNIIINSFFLLFLLLKCWLFFPNISFLTIKLDRIITFFDKLGILLVILTIFSVIIIFFSNFNFSYIFYFLRKILLATLFLVYISSNLLRFYFFFEVTIIPTIIIIIIWGYQPERLQAAFYFFFYTILASLPLFIFILFSFVKNKSNLIALFYPFSFSLIWWVIVVLAFLVKLPIFFLHLWLPKAHVEAPLGGSIILAAVLLKLGGIGIFRMMNMFKWVVSSPLVSAFSVWGRVLTALICLQQRDLKAIIAYSSVAHMRFLAARIFLGSETGINGTILIIFFHGLSRAALFMLAKMVYDLTNSRALVLTKGKINVFPIFTLFWALMITMNIGIPPARRFWSEILLIFGYLFKRRIFLVLFFLIAFFSTVYSCFLLINIHHGKPLLKINPFQGFPKSNFCPMFIFAFFSFLLFLSPSTLLLY